MLRTNTKTLFSIVAIMALGVIIFLFATRSTQDAQGTQSLQENVKASLTSNQMQASRTDKGLYIIDRENFEQTVRKNLPATRGAAFQDVKDKDIKFAYLINRDGKDAEKTFADSHGNKKMDTLVDPKGKYLAVKGVRVLIDGNDDGVFTSEEDHVATLVVDTDEKEDDTEFSERIYDKSQPLYQNYR